MKMKKLQISTLAALGLAALVALAPATPVKAAAPTNVAQTVSTQDGFKVTWSKVEGATDYMVSISADGKTFGTEVSTKGACEYAIVDSEKKVLKSGTTYIVKVRAVGGSSTGTGTGTGTTANAATAKVATAPEAMSSFEQVSATSSSAKLSWTQSAGATGYLVKIGSDAASAKDLITVTTPNINLTGLKPDTAYYVAVYPIRKVTDKFYASDKCVYNNRVITTAADVDKFEIAEWDVRRNYIRFSWKNSAKYEGGYQLELTNSAGKVYKTYNIRGRKVKGAGLTISKLKNKGFSARVRTYNRLNGELSYGDWSDIVYCVPEANVTAKKLTKDSVQLDWAKIAGAKNYTVFVATEDGGDYKKLASTKANTYTATGLVEGNTYYYLVKANKVAVKNGEGSTKKKGTTDLNVNNDVVVRLLPGKAAAEVE